MHTSNTAPTTFLVHIYTCCLVAIWTGLLQIPHVARILSVYDTYTFKRFICSVLSIFRNCEWDVAYLLVTKFKIVSLKILFEPILRFSQWFSCFMVCVHSLDHTTFSPDNTSLQFAMKLRQHDTTMTTSIDKGFNHWLFITKIRMCINFSSQILQRHSSNVNPSFS